MFLFSIPLFRLSRGLSQGKLNIEQLINIQANAKGRQEAIEGERRRERERKKKKPNTVNLTHLNEVNRRESSAWALV